MSIIPPPILSLQATSASFPFQTKFIPIQGNLRIVLGSQIQEPHPGTTPRRAHPTNGYFAPIPAPDGSPISPITLSATHAEVWISNGQIWIRDVGTGFGTFVNGTQINEPVPLRRGDIISLGTRLVRNANTPPYILEEQLKAVVAKVSLSGV